MTESDVLLIRETWDGTWEHIRHFASVHGVRPQSVDKIVRRINWQHLPAQPGDRQPDPDRSYARGEHVHGAKLNAEAAVKILAAWDAVPDKYRARAGFCRDFAKNLDVRPVAIDKVLRRINWRHL